MINIIIYINWLNSSSNVIAVVIWVIYDVFYKKIYLKIFWFYFKEEKNPVVLMKMIILIWKK